MKVFILKLSGVKINHRISVEIKNKRLKWLLLILDTLQCMVNKYNWHFDVKYYSLTNSPFPFFFNFTTKLNKLKKKKWQASIWNFVSQNETLLLFFKAADNRIHVANLLTWQPHWYYRSHQHLPHTKIPENRGIELQIATSPKKKLSSPSLIRKNNFRIFFSIRQLFI